MKNLNLFLSTLALVLLTSSIFAQNVNVEKTLVKSFNLQGNDVVELDLKGKVEVQHWNNSIMRIQMNIGLENGSSSMLKSLVQAGRYNLRSVEKDGVYKVYSPGMNRDVRIKGKELVEVLSYTVFLPQDVMVQESTEASTSVDNKLKNIK